MERLYGYVKIQIGIVEKVIFDVFLKELGKSLTNSHNERRDQQSGHTSKAKLALQSLGFELKPKISINQVHMNNFMKRKRRYYIYPTHPGRKIQQVFDICKNNV
jgi:hypothetical protein